MTSSDFIKKFEEFCIKNRAELLEIRVEGEMWQIGKTIPLKSLYDFKVRK